MAAKKTKSNSAVIYTGFVRDACCTGFHMLPSTAKRFGFNYGDYLQVDAVERGTRIVRQLVACNRGCSGMRGSHIYMDNESAYYLMTEVRDEVSVRLADYAFDSP